MSSLSQEHCQLIKEIFSQSLTENGYSSLPLDHWIECSMNKVQSWRQGEKVAEEWNRPTYSHEEYKQHQHVCMCM